VFYSQFIPLNSTKALLAAAICLTMTSVPALAQRGGASPQAVSTFLSNPSEVLAKSPNGGPELVSAVRDLVQADPATLQPIVNLLANASKGQKSSIGAALAQAAKIVVRTNPAFAAQIQQAILDTKDQDVVLAFAAASGDSPIGAGAGGGAGGAGGGASGGQVSPLPGGPTGTGGPQQIGGGGVNTPLFSYTSSVAGLAPTTNTGTTTFTTISSSVSP
jgi:hypothetical protein